MTFSTSVADNRFMKRLAFVLLLTMLIGPGARAAEQKSWNIAILVYDGVYNTEFVAPLDVFDHVGGRTEDRINVFLVSPSGGALTSVEKLRFESDFRFGEHPAVDVLVVPSFENYESDLGSRKDVIDWIRKTAKKARYVLSNCWGAFFLAKAGLLEGRSAMTYPPDITKLGEQFPGLKAVEGYRFVHDGRFVTGGGGVASYDNALYVVEKIWGPEVAQGIASGLVKEWDLEKVPHLVVR